MKQKILKLITASTVFFVTNAAFASSIDTIANQSAKYFLNTARYASNDGADTVYYNPAGTAFMDKGIYLSLSSQTIFMPYEQSVSVVTPAGKFSESYSQNNPAPVLPNFYIVDNFGKQGIGNLAMFIEAGVTAGGGTLKWNGTAGTAITGFAIANMINSQGGQSVLNKTDVDFNATSEMFKIGGGAAYSLNDTISLSAGMRYISARKEIEMKGRFTFADFSGALPSSWTTDVDYKTDLDAEGYTFVIGADVKPVKDLTIGIKYETETELNFKYNNKHNNAYDSIGGSVADGVIAQNAQADGTKTNGNLPALLALGAEYNLTKDLLVSASSVFYFMNKTDLDGVEKYYNTGYDLALGTTYRVMDDLKLGLCFTYMNTGVKDSYFKDDKQALSASANAPLKNSYYLTGGATYNITRDVDVTASGGYQHYFSEKYTTDMGFNVEYKKDVYVLGCEVGYKI